MKNTVIIDHDTERANPIMIGKPKEQPTTAEGETAMLADDIHTLTEALITLIQVAHNQGHISVADNVTLLEQRVIEGLEVKLPEAPETTDPEEILP